MASIKSYGHVSWDLDIFLASQKTQASIKQLLQWLYSRDDLSNTILKVAELP